MGRQIHFYMLADDRSDFMRFVREDDQAVVTLRDSDSPEVEPLSDLSLGDHKTLCLWNRRFLPHLEREKIAVPGMFRIESLHTPTIEFNSSFKQTWEGKPALGQGRLYGHFDPYLEKPAAFAKWYDHLTHWIRKNYQRSPFRMGGYLGPAAYEFYKKGGYLLGQVLPLRTEVWLAEIGKQHSPSTKPLQAFKRAKTFQKKR